MINVIRSIYMRSRHSPYIFYIRAIGQGFIHISYGQVVLLLRLHCEQNSNYRVFNNLVFIYFLTMWADFFSHCWVVKSAAVRVTLSLVLVGDVHKCLIPLIVKQLLNCFVESASWFFTIRSWALPMLELPIPLDKPAYTL